jgi:DNA adenine methylase
MNAKSNENSRLRPPLKWAGGKRWLVPHLITLWKPHSSRRYVEPFCGGLAVALGLAPQNALLNDINPQLINFYRQVQLGLELKIEMRNEQTLFYQQRERFNELMHASKTNGNGNGTTRRLHSSHSLEAAQLFYYLNRTCFNGLCRFNQSGEFNVPFGTYKSITYATDFFAYKEIFSNWTFSNSDFESIPFDADDFIYADPPYDVEFTTYSAGGFSWEDQVRTAELLSEHKGPVVISNQATKRIVSLYKRLGFKLSYLDAPRRISCTGDRSSAREVLATKNIQ